MSTMDGEHPHVPDQLVDQLVKGYDALGVEIKLLDEQRQELENRLSWAKQQYLDALKRFTPQTASQDFHTFLSELDEAGICEPETPTNWLDTAQRSTDDGRKTRAYNIQRATDAREKISYRQRASDSSHGVRIWNGKSADTLDSGIEMEKDFTTYSGVPGRLKCPFVAPKNRPSVANAINGANGHRTPRGSSISRGSISGRRSKRSSFHDPVRAEFCGFDPAVSASPSIEGSAPLCPIRFLDQHSPEEVANYFEKHKHELPKSHEDCVKRYQSNEASIKELDAKYGNLVTMISGLGQVHQPMFPEVPDEEAVEDGEPDSTQKVRKWATDVNASLHSNDDDLGAGNGMEDALAINDTDEERQPHFDRPLKDVRVGESPSRPWGITVPLEYQEKDGTDAKSDHTASPRDTPDLRMPEQVVQPGQTVPKGKCPFDHTKLAGMTGRMPNHKLSETVPEPTPPASQPVAEPSRIPQAARSPSSQQHSIQDALKPVSQMIFNGPVFFGYGVEQAMAMLQQSGGLGKSA